MKSPPYHATQVCSVSFWSLKIDVDFGSKGNLSFSSRLFCVPSITGSVFSTVSLDHLWIWCAVCDPMFCLYMDEKLSSYVSIEQFSPVYLITLTDQLFSFCDSINRCRKQMVSWQDLTHHSSFLPYSTSIHMLISISCCSTAVHPSNCVT